MVSFAKTIDQTDLLLIEENVTSPSGASDFHRHTPTSQPALTAGMDSNGLFDKVSSIYNEERVRLILSVSEEFSSDFALVRGLIEFNRPRHLAFEYNQELRTVEADIRSNRLGELEQFLSLVFDLMVRERRFRGDLKRAIEFENRSRLERERIYANLSTATAVRRQRLLTCFA